MYTITVSTSTGGTVLGGGNFISGENCTVKAKVAEHYTFDGWYEGTMKISSSAEYSFTVTTSRTLEARFNIITCDVVLDATHGGTTNGSGLYDHGSICTINALPNTGYLFNGWYKNEQHISNEKRYSFNITDDTYLLAKFIVNPETFTTIAETTSPDGKKIKLTTIQRKYLIINEYVHIQFTAEPANAYFRQYDPLPVLISGSAGITRNISIWGFGLTPTALGTLKIQVCGNTIMEFTIIN
jgi:hypothetical protein